jgi:hypothetical protein
VPQPSSHESDAVARYATHLGIGFFVGAGAGAFAGAADMAAAAAVTAKRDALFAALFLAMYGFGFGALFGAITGFALGVITLPFSGRPRLLRRLRLVWGLLAGAIVVGLCSLVFGLPSFVPGPNDTLETVRSDLVWFYAVPTLLAFILGVALAPLLARNGRSPPVVDAP